MSRRAIKNTEVANALKTTESNVSRWRSGVLPRESTRRALVRFINKKDGFDPVTEADLGWETEAASV